MKTVLRLGRAALAGALLAILVISTGFGYAGQVGGAVTVTVPTGSIPCNTPTVVTATVLDNDGKPVAGMDVAWAFKKGTEQAGDKIDPLTSTTDAQGVARTTVTLACIAGDRGVTASPGDAVGGAVLGVTSPGLPNTSTLPPDKAPVPASLPAIASVLALFGGLLLALRKAGART
jgi:hypothetical protein